MRKVIAAFTLAAFVIYSWSCVFHKTRKESAEGLARRHQAKIVGIQKKSGEYIEFRKNYPATVQNGAVVGEVLTTLELNKDEIKSRKERESDGSILYIWTKDGRTFSPILAPKFQGDKLTFKTYQPVSIALSDIQLAWVRRVNVLPTVAVNTGIAVVAVGAVFLIALATGHYGISSGGGTTGGEGFGWMSSCPFIYSYDGEQYIFDAEPYGTAVCRGLKRTDYIVMDHLRIAGEQYKVLLTNQLNETEYTDELKLIAVDHPPGVKIFPDALGRVHTFTRLSAPLKAYDQNGQDVLPLIAQSDKLFWVSDPETKDPAKAEDLRDELTFEFAKPTGARQAKLVVNAWTTMWGAAMADRFLELRGRSLQAWYDDVNRHGPEFLRAMKWFMNEELYFLKIWVETKDGWKARGVIQGGEPRLTKEKVYVLDISDVPGEILRVKLRPPVNFWMVNSLAVDYSQDLPVETAVISAIKATNQDGQDVRLKLLALDDDFLETPNSGGYTDIVFPAPPLKEGLDRTILLKAAGYYDIHLDTAGEPRLQLFDRVADEPGFAVRYAIEEYEKWEEGLRANMGRR